MLLLTQMAAGFFLFDWLYQGPEVLALLAWSLLLLGLIASTTHLGRPLGAWRAFFRFAALLVESRDRGLLCFSFSRRART